MQISNIAVHLPRHRNLSFAIIATDRLQDSRVIMYSKLVFLFLLMTFFVQGYFRSYMPWQLRNAVHVEYPRAVRVPSTRDDTGG